MDIQNREMGKAVKFIINTEKQRKTTKMGLACKRERFKKFLAYGELFSNLITNCR